jgi:hypothetical protein
MTIKNAANQASKMDESSIAKVHATLFVTGPTKSVEAQTALLETIASEQQTAPTHGSLDERKRKPFSLITLATEAATSMGDPILWRLTPPKYWGVIDATSMPIARISFEYEDIDHAHVASVCNSIARLIDKLKPEYAALDFTWTELTEEHAASARGFSAKALQYCRFGPPGVFFWTWFGPRLVDLFGEALLLEQGATLIAWGGASLPLVEQPWTATFEELRKRQITVDKALRAKGIFGDYSKPAPQKGPQWIPLVASKGRA